MADRTRNPAWEKSTVTGTVVKKTIRMLERDYYVAVQVEYEVDGTTYLHKEALEAVLDPASPAESPCMPALAVYEGDEVAVCYDPEKPKRAYLRDNVRASGQEPYMYIKQNRPEPERPSTWGATTAVGTVVHREGAYDGSELYCLLDVEYEVEGRTYRHREVLCATHEGSTQKDPRGKRVQRPVLDAHTGDGVIVCYDHAHPARAYLRDNVLSELEAEANKAAAKQKKLATAAPAIVLIIVILLLCLM